MTWVTVQSHDIGDTFPGIYALEKTFGVGSANAICSWGQEQERVLRVAVWSFWDQSQERLQVVAALSGRGSQKLWRMLRVARATEGKCIILCGEDGCVRCARSIRVGEQKVATLAATSFPWAKAPSGSEHAGALACGVAFGQEAAASGARRR